MVERQTPEREVKGSKPTSTIFVSLSKTLYSRESTGNTQEEVAPSRHD